MQCSWFILVLYQPLTGVFATCERNHDTSSWLLWVPGFHRNSRAELPQRRATARVGTSLADFAALLIPWWFLLVTFRVCGKSFPTHPTDLLLIYLAYHIWKCILVPKPDMKAFLGTLPDLPSCMVLWGRYILSINVLKYKNFEILSDSLDTLYFCDCPIRHVSSAPNFCVQLRNPKTPNVLLNQTNTRFWGSQS